MELMISDDERSENWVRIVDGSENDGRRGNNAFTSGGAGSGRRDTEMKL